MQRVKKLMWIVARRPPSRAPFWTWLGTFARRWDSPGWSFLYALVAYGLLTYSIHGSQMWQATPFAYFNYLADALLHGQLHFRILPPTTIDLSYFDGRYYAYWGPLPALLMMPFVASFGVQFSDSIFTFVIGALNVALVAQLLRLACAHRVIRLSRLQRGMLVIFFALGTVHITLAPNARVWFTGQLVGFLFVALAYIVALSRRGPFAFVLSGAAISCALLTRNHLIFAGVWPAWYLLAQHHAQGHRRLAGYVVVGVIPILTAVLLILLYNQQRFGSFTDNGLAYHQMAPVFRADYERYGAFNMHYLLTNLYYQYIVYPLPLRPETPMGGSLFLLSPVFVGAIWGGIKERRRMSTLVLLASVALVATPILLLMGTGYVQFGPRYTLDFYCPLLLLTAIGIRRWPVTVVGILTAISIVHFVIGAGFLR